MIINYKKFFFFVVILIIAVGFIACKRNTGQNVLEKASEKMEKVKTHDITKENKKVVFADAGEIIYVALYGKSEDKFQWSLREPLSGNYISLVKHDVVSQKDNRIKEGELISEWKFKIEKEGEFNLRLEYENAFISKNPKDVFVVKVINPKSKDAQKKIFIDQPVQNQVINHNVIKLMGFASVYEATLNYRLNDTNNKILDQGFIQTTAGAPDYGYFEKDVKLATSPKTLSGILEVFQISAQDGSEIDTEKLNVIFDPQTQIVKVYFNNDKLDPSVSCDKVFPVERYIKKTSGAARAAIEQLLLGVTAFEKQLGYSNNLPTEKIIIKSLKIDNGIALIDFNNALQQGVGGSCRVTAIRAQIIETLKQFDSVQKVVISIDGKTEDILQP